MNPLLELSKHVSSTPKLVLSMIAGNEERVIARCLASVLPHVDAMVVSVNGRDGTEEIVSAMGAHVVRQPWQDFGKNRTLAAQAARRHALHDLKLDGANTYLLLIDADMVLKVDDAKFRERLSFPHYRIDQRYGGSNRAENSRLLRLDHDWRCIRRTHEYWSAFPDVYPQRFDGIWIDDLNDGGEHGRKYERDVDLLLKDLDENPGDARALFYLGETFFHWAQQASERGERSTASWRFLQAIDYYERRWGAGDWDEERWFAKFKKGLAQMELGEDCFTTLLDAYEARPGRAEVMSVLSRRYRLLGKNALSVLYAKAARATPPTRDALFVDESAWTTKPDEDLAICSYYVGDLEGGMAACMRLSRARELGSGYQDFVAKTAAFYVPQQVQASMRGTFRIPEEVLEGGLWAPSTPTIVRAQRGGFLVGVRLVNYEQQRGRWYVSRATDGVIRTKNAVLWLSDDFKEQKFLGEQQYHLPKGWNPDPRIQGLEDQRWTVHRGQVWFTATTFDGNPPRGPRVVLGRLSDDGLQINVLADLDYGTNCEKNWAPRSFDIDLELIYSYDPFTLLTVTGTDTEPWPCAVRKNDSPLVATRWRGGAFNRNLGIVHEVVHHENHNVYFHRFVDTSGKTVNASRPFTFDHHGIEYAAGICEYDYRVIVTYSFEDRESRFIVFSTDELRRLFP